MVGGCCRRWRRRGDAVHARHDSSRKAATRRGVAGQACGAGSDLHERDARALQRRGGRLANAVNDGGGQCCARLADLPPEVLDALMKYEKPEFAVDALARRELHVQEQQLPKQVTQLPPRRHHCWLGRLVLLRELRIFLLGGGRGLKQLARRSAARAPRLGSRVHLHGCCCGSARARHPNLLGGFKEQGEGTVRVRSRACEAVHPHWGSPAYTLCPPRNGFKKSLTT